MLGVGDSVVVKLTDQFGRTVYDTITVNYYAPPAIEISYPSYTTHDTLTKTIYIRGTTDNTRIGDTIQVYVNTALNTTIVLTANDANFSGTVTLTGIADSVWVKLNGFSGLAYDTITLNYFDTPVVEISYPGYTSHDTNVQEISIFGTSIRSDIGDSISLYVNGVLNSVTSLSAMNGAWSNTVTVTNVYDSVVVKLTDQFGRTVYDTINVNYFAPPTIEITYPHILTHDTYTQIITISGTTSNSRNGDTVEIYTDGISNTVVVLTVINGTFSGTAALNSVSDSILVKISAMGGTAYDTINVNYFGPATAEITYPDYTTHDTMIQNIYIRGTTANTRSGDTVQVYVNTTLNTTIVLTANGGTFSGTVTLTGIADSVWVKLNGFSGFAYDTIIVNFISDITLKITYPDTIWHDTMVKLISVKGTSASLNGTPVNIYCNGILNSIATVNSNLWAGTAYITGFGDSLVAYSSWMSNTFYDTVTVNYFDTPTIEIIYPINNHDTSTASITIRGTSNNTQLSNALQIFRNGVLQVNTLMSSYNGNWNGAGVNLLGLGDSISVYITDRFGRIAYDTITVNYNGVVNVAITYPTNNLSPHDTNVIPIFISGSSSSNDSGIIYIYKNGILQCTASIISNTWSGTTSLTSIGDSITAKVIDSFMNIAWDTITVNYDTIAPSKPAFLIAIADVTLPDTGVQLNWNANSELDSQYYNIYRDTTGLGIYIKINANPILLTNYFDSQAKRGDTQYYAVTCIDRYGNESLYSDSAGAGNVVYIKTIYGITVGGNTVSIRPGATITYNISYQNDGFAPINSMIIYDTIAVSVVEFKVGSVQIINGNSAITSYSNDNAISFIYVPAGTVDNNVTNTRLQLNGKVCPMLSGNNGNIRLGVVIK